MKSLFSRFFVAVLAITLASCSVSERESQAETLDYSDVIISDLSETTISESTVQTDLTETSTESTTQRVRTYELSEFSLAKPEHIKLSEDKDFATFNFNDEDIINLFDEAFYIKRAYFECMSGKFVFSDFGKLPTDNTDADPILDVFTYSGISYDSFVKFLNCYFTEEYTQKLLEQGITEYGENNIVLPYKNVDGELCYSAGLQLGTTPLMDSIVVNITDRTEEEINITVTARYCHPEIPDKEDFRDYSCVIKMTPNGWRVDYMKLWYWHK